MVTNTLSTHSATLGHLYWLTRDINLIFQPLHALFSTLHPAVQLLLLLTADRLCIRQMDLKRGNTRSPVLTKGRMASICLPDTKHKGTFMLRLSMKFSYSCCSCYWNYASSGRSPRLFKRLEVWRSGWWFSPERSSRLSHLNTLLRHSATTEEKWWPRPLPTWPCDGPGPEEPCWRKHHGKSRGSERLDIVVQPSQTMPRTRFSQVVNRSVLLLSHKENGWRATSTRKDNFMDTSLR